EHLRAAQEQVTVRREREAEVGEDAVLRLGAEVDQRVARDQQVDARDRGVLDEVVAPEDDDAAQLLAEREAAVYGLEVALAERLRNGGDRLRRVQAVAACAQRLLVDVRRVDLDPAADLLVAHR